MWRELSCRDHAEERVWRYLDTCQFQTHLHARILRVDCPEHGVVQMRVPWAEVSWSTESFGSPFGQ